MQLQLKYISLYLHGYLSSYRLIGLSKLYAAKRRPSASVSTMALTFPPPAVREMAAEVSSLLKDRSQTVCVAETVRPASPALSLLLFRGSISC